jgi:predicted transcriptional regulator
MTPEPALDDDDEDLFDTPDLEADEASYQRGLADHAAGRVISNEAMMRWFASWGTANPLPRPKCGE